LSRCGFFSVRDLGAKPCGGQWAEGMRKVFHKLFTGVLSCPSLGLEDRERRRDGSRKKARNLVPGKPGIPDLWFIRGSSWNRSQIYGRETTRKCSRGNSGRSPPRTCGSPQLWGHGGFRSETRQIVSRPLFPAISFSKRAGCAILGLFSRAAKDCPSKGASRDSGSEICSRFTF